MIRKKTGGPPPAEDPPSDNRPRPQSVKVNPGSFLESSELTPILALLQELVPAVALEKIHQHLPSLFSLAERSSSLLTRTPQVRQCLMKLQETATCEYCKVQSAQLSLACSHRLCLDCFYTLLREVTSNCVVYNRFEKLTCPELVCKLCNQPISTKDLDKGLPNFHEFQRAAKDREAKILEQCQACRGPNETSQHDCFCKKCFAMALLRGDTTCSYCQQELHPQDLLQAELAMSDDFTVRCKGCDLAVPFRYILPKACCGEVLCGICQVAKGTTQCVICQRELDWKAKERLQLLTQELEQVALEEPSLLT